MLDAINNWFIALFASFGAAFSSLCEKTFYPVLIKFFGPINTFLSGVYQPWANIMAIGLFIGTMIWVCAILKESYVNIGRPVKAWYTDLRIWTVISMLPHIFVYIYFTKG